MRTTVASYAIESGRDGKYQHDSQDCHTVHSKRTYARTPIQHQPGTPFMMHGRIDGWRKRKYITDGKLATLCEDAHERHFMEGIVRDIAQTSDVGEESDD